MWSNLNCSNQGIGIRSTGNIKIDQSVEIENFSWQVRKIIVRNLTFFIRNILCGICWSPMFEMSTCFTKSYLHVMLERISLTKMTLGRLPIQTSSSKSPLHYSAWWDTSRHPRVKRTMPKIIEEKKETRYSQFLSNLTCSENFEFKIGDESKTSLFWFSTICRANNCNSLNILREV